MYKAGDVIICISQEGKMENVPFPKLHTTYTFLQYYNNAKHNMKNWIMVTEIPTAAYDPKLFRKMESYATNYQVQRKIKNATPLQITNN